MAQLDFDKETKRVTGEIGLWEIELNSGRRLNILQNSEESWRDGAELSFHPTNTFKVLVVSAWGFFQRDRIVEVREVFVDARQVCMASRRDDKFTVQAKLVNR